MKIEEILDKKVGSTITSDKVIGIDIGSRTGKAVLFHEGELYTAITPTAVFAQQTADKLFEKLLKQSGLQHSDIVYIVGTGYGRIALNFGGIKNKIVTEISCHAMGAHALNAKVRSIVDIGGQDSKAIRVDPKTGKVVEFIMNDKCAAGTGRFLEKVAGLLDLTTEQLGDEALKATKPSDISSQCVVFAESEVISLKAKGEKRADIAAGIHIATARRVKNLFNRIGLEADLVFSGGVSNNRGMKKALEEVLDHPFSVVKLDAIYAGALGAAVIAQKTVAADRSEKEGLAS
ncbi:MAG TPA: acyl-CoA dehydratase activase [Methylomusa anaerophila]|uniref:R-phenyllactate dehydratase activator n=1 Tax=Methylomusa anaerophila TaxID=1930071 RepID=A0A348AEM3_9FIRM|nr:acyl-CoA dehydratase activase [Methylomusa anaerophila]BBB89521.1 R-phenyllactate dehydratase activator [Methylomusa anaerophila]HML90109.1 acyl-CoA dehydratase activase [Methylomusa anaerophila]